MTPTLHLAPAVRYIYPRVEIDLGSSTAWHSNGYETALVGQVYTFLGLLLDYPGRVLTYWQLAQVLLPELSSLAAADRRQPAWAGLDRRQQASIRRAIHSLAYRTRAALGEETSRESIVVNRTKLGYAVRRPLRIEREEHRPTVVASRATTAFW
jgi:hypothetical protein